jgi:hypothetical protein
MRRKDGLRGRRQRAEPPRASAFVAPAAPEVGNVAYETNFDGACMESELIPFGVQDSGPFFHGTKADLKAGDLLAPGYSSNYGERRTAN